MGLLTSGPLEENIQKARIFAEAMCVFWNERLFQAHEGKPPVHIEVFDSRLEYVCRVGAQIFATEAFPRDPGPYKRVAAFMVLGRYHPFFQIDLLNIGTELGTHDEQLAEKEAWISRILIAMLDPLIGSMSVRLNGKEMQLPKWRGFPSKHVHLDVANWLRWLKNPNNITYVATTLEGARPIDWEQLAMERQIRAIMALALIIENSHYASLGEEKSQIVGQVSDCLIGLSETAKLDLLTLTWRK